MSGVEAEKSLKTREVWPGGLETNSTRVISRSQELVRNIFETRSGGAL
jgi:hypothetical protein